MSKRKYNEQQLNEFLGSLFRAIGRRKGKQAAKMIAKDPEMKKQVARVKKAQEASFKAMKQVLQANGMWDAETERDYIEKYARARKAVEN